MEWLLRVPAAEELCVRGAIHCTRSCRKRALRRGRSLRPFDNVVGFVTDDAMPTMPALSRYRRDSLRRSIERRNRAKPKQQDIGKPLIRRPNVDSPLLRILLSDGRCGLAIGRKKRR